MIDPRSSTSSHRSVSLVSLLTLIALLLAMLPPPLLAQAGLPAQSFDASSAPSGWSVVNTPANSPGWSFNNPGERSNETGAPGNFAIADSDHAGSGTSMDTALLTPSFSLAGVSTARLQFRTLFRPYENSTADVDVSVDGGTNWSNVWRTTTAASGQVTVDLSASAANQANVQVRFRYYNANWAWYWQVDDVSVVALAAPPAPTGLSTTVSGSQVALSWNAAGGATGYTIRRSTDGTNFSDLAALTARNTSYTDTNNIACATTYTYQVVASNAAGSSAAGSNATATIPACAGVSGVSEAFGSTTTPVNWTVVNNGVSDGWRFDDPANRKGFFNTSDNFAIADNLQGSAATMNSELRTPVLNLSGLPGVKLTFRTFFYNVGNAVADVDVSSDGGSNWTNAWRATSSVNNQPPFRTITLDLSAAAGNQANVIVRFRMHNSARTAIWLIDDVSLVSEGAPAAPTNLSAGLDSGGAVKLTWSGSAPGYEVERAPGGSTNFTKIADVGNQATTFTDITVAANTPYIYRVRAKNAGGTSAYSNETTVTSGNRVVRVVNMTLSYYDTAANTNAKRAAIEANLRYFAEAMFEMSNGANKLGRVEVYVGGQNSDRSDIVWIASCWPNANIAGYGTTGARIQHCDDFQGTSFINDDTAHRNGGYTLAHEMGHYFYSLYDEYRGSSATGQWPGSPLSSDNPVNNSVMHSQWNAVDGNLNWLNFSTPLNNTGVTAQQRVYGASAWETLVRPLSADPRDGQRSSAPVRLYHPELAAVAPETNVAPRIDLNSEAARAEARSAINIVWVGQSNTANGLQQTGADLARQIVVDVSENTSASQLAAIKVALKSLVDRAEDGQIFSLVSYASSEVVLLSPTAISDQSSRDTIKAVIDDLATISAADTAMGEALSATLSGDASTGIPDTTTRAVYLFSSAVHSGATHPASLIGAFQSNAVSIFAFDLAEDEALTLELYDLTTETEGEYFTAIDAIDLQLAVSEADQIASPAVDVGITDGVGFATSSAAFTKTLTLDASVGVMDIDIIYLGDPTDAIVSLSRPDGSPSGVSFEPFTSEDGFGGQYTLLSGRADALSAGDWLLTVETSLDSLDLYFLVSGEAKINTMTFFAEVDSVSGDQITYPEPIVITAAVGKDFMITGAGVRGEVTAPDGTVSEVTLIDDGVAPDHLANDGYYSAIVNYRGDGEYLVTVAFDNNSGNAEFTEEAVAPAPDPNGNTRPAQRYPVDENFQRFDSISIEVFGSQDDDHADDIDDATVISADNKGINGRIDFADDFDVFRLDVPADYSGELILRVANLALGMDPFVYAFDADESWEVEQIIETEPTSDSFLVVTLPPSAGKTVYILVAHLDETVDQGLYELSVGPGLQGEAAVATTSKLSSFLYLPLLAR